MKGITNMKKEDQIAINNFVEKACENALAVWNNNNHGRGKQLNSMNARVYTIGTYKFLVSYETLVAFIDKDDVCFDIMRMFTFEKITKRYYYGGYWEDTEYTNYSRSSARQISTFFRQYGNANSVYTYREC